MNAKSEALNSKKVGNEIKMPYSKRMKKTKNLESMRSRTTAEHMTDNGATPSSKRDFFRGEKKG